MSWISVVITKKGNTTVKSFSCLRFLIVLSACLIQSANIAIAQEGMSAAEADKEAQQMLGNVDAGIANLDTIILFYSTQRDELMGARSRLLMTSEPEFQAVGWKEKVVKESAKKVYKAYKKYKELERTIDETTKQHERNLETLKRHHEMRKKKQ